MRWGIKSIIAESFAEIFFGNCTTLGIPCVTATRSDLEKLTAAINADPKVSVTVDLNACRPKQALSLFRSRSRTVPDLP